MLKIKDISCSKISQSQYLRSISIFCHFLTMLSDNYLLIGELSENLEHPISQLTLSASVEKQQSTCMRSKYWHFL